ncbi:uncharacterized protein SPAPADRAFT_138093 [Spathaspora passalidarum NRRL Y-27907]|uniref:RNA helicase n=1 Tax=Spathaspora passalidarum (strain NRRL Y-27907 / 11-Y1) TaxID=619300 RepID=G3AP84_SPAPN|nr:uncharacterized protein SPAPADRAFT_138093 [Spathaspora passalidarum NRRL Y-27907]EGW32655.1 hypothetical protein SPAPADRAFT_138093 [Spathaspora passalidarum NRRL Y-27907]
MNQSSVSIPSEWPPFFTRLAQIFFQINTHLTFLSSHSRNIIPSIELLQKLNNTIIPLDLVIIKSIFPPGEIFFDYVDENQVQLSFIEEVKIDPYKGYQQTPIADKLPDEHEHHSKHILIFDFQDAKLHSIAAAVKGKKRVRYEQGVDFDHDQRREFFLSSSAYNLTPLTHSQLIHLINSRNGKFIELIKEYIDQFHGQSKYSLAEEKLLAKANKLIPEPPHLTDIIEDVQEKDEIIQESTMDLSSDEMIQALKDSRIYQDQIAIVQTLDQAKGPEYNQLSARVSDTIHPDLKQALLAAKGISIDEGLYTHQTMALENLLSNDSHVIVSTPTASGKSLIYQIPMLNAILWDIQSGLKTRYSTAFFIFPTKALAQDQLRHLRDFIKYIPNLKRPITVNAYDGDTPFKEREQIMKESDILFTNPDTIHASILPKNHYGPWKEFLTQLKFVVMDELHVYRGTFGINVSFVMGRLQRINHMLSPGDKPVRFVSCSATIQNPVSHFRAVCSLSQEDTVVHVAQDGSPHCEKKLVVWNPPLLMNKRGDKQKTDSNSPMAPRVGMIAESAKVLLSLLSAYKEIKAIVFCPIRVVCEMLMKEVRYLLQNTSFSKSGIDQSDILAYRGGYSKSDRRIIERKMFDGQLRAIIATNALELGIDLSDLDVVICCGFPMSKSNLHQQFGRAGRGHRTSGSLAIFVPGRNPLDQYYLDNPLELVDRTYEELCVQGLRNMDSSSLILERHLQCAAYEEAIDLQNDFKWILPGGSFKMYSQLVESHLLLDNDGKYKPHPSFLPKPHNLVQIRAVEEVQFAVVDITNNRNIIIEEVEASRTSFTLYEGGIFLHQGQQYLVKEFNHKDHYAKVERVNVDWTTSQRDFTDIDPEEVESVKPLYPMEHPQPLDIPAFFGKIKITMKVFGFFKVNRREEIIEAVEVKNPPVIMHAKGFWINVPRQVLKILEGKQLSAAGAVHASEHAIMNMLPIFINGSPDKGATIGTLELATECKAPTKEFSGRESSRKRPARLIFYDTKGGKLGSGISYKSYECIDAILHATFKRVKNCLCEWGCPLCIISSDCREQMKVISKPGAILVLGSILGKDLDILKDEVPDGPEFNMPDVNTDTIVESSSNVKFSPDVKILQVTRNRRCFTGV